MSHGRILHLEDNASDAFLVQHWLVGGGIDAEILLASDADTYRKALSTDRFDLILADSSVPSMSPLEALHLAHEVLPDVPFVCLSGAADEQTVKIMLAAGAADYVLKDHEWRLIAVAQRELRGAQRHREQQRLADHMRATLRLVDAVQELSLARDLDSICASIRRAAREMTGADGATFVLRDGDQCLYMDEDAIAPLWKGQKFPVTGCISGWSMLHHEPAIVENVYDDDRIPVDVYRPTFVQSLVMVPIRQDAPIGAIGNYWATPHRAEPHEVELLQALANTAAVAIENLGIYRDLEHMVRDRTRQLEATNRELETFSYSVSHDLRAPLRTIRGYTDILRDGPVDDACRESLEQIRTASDKMGNLIEDLLRLARVAGSEVSQESVDLTSCCRDVLKRLQASEPERHVEVAVEETMVAYGDRGLLELLLDNLLSNAWKYSSRTGNARIEVGCELRYDGSCAYYVRDNGIGFDMKDASRLFTPFQRMHTAAEFPGDGIGLATVQRIVHKHGGELWARSAPGEGATFYFTLSEESAPRSLQVAS